MDKDSSLIKAAKKQDEPYIVGIGASAGGLEALQSLLAALPVDLGFAYVLIQHLSPDYKSLLSEILAKNTTMPVIQVEDHMPINPDSVYVIPPRKTMYISDGCLCLDEQKSGELHLPIDTFFQSLAENVGANAIAVVLSGTGSDGTNGVKSIKENDGMVIVQNPENSKFDGMPKSAMRTGLVDFLGTPEEIALELEHVSIAAKGGNLLDKTEREIDDELMGRIYYLLKKASDINFTHYKRATLLRRVERRMLLARKETLAEYVDFLGERPDEAKILAKEVLIGVTNFFREPEYFEVLKEKAIKNIVANGKEEEPIRVWVAGCSTGEEAYSIAILFCEVMETLKIRREVKIFATDLDAEAVAIAGKGVYGTSISSAVSTTRLSRYFTRRGNNYTINRDVRKMLIFSPHNVIQDPPFARLDLISCRNLLIYFQPVLQKDLFSIFHAALKDGGYLFLGKSEAVGTYTEVFPVVDAMAKIFTHHSKVKIPGAKAVPFLQNMIDDETYMGVDSAPYNGREDTKEEISDQMAINTELLERFMPACLVVNEKNELVYVYGNSKNYISFPVGRVTSALFDIIAEPLRIPVSTALKEAREKQKMVQYTGIHFTGDMSSGYINLTALPISRPKEEADTLYALVFAEIKESDAIPDAMAYDINHMAAQRITDLEQELTGVHDKLTKSVTEQECVNEELQASNEELLTANEELQSSNEELQSVNEELYTVNAEYQMKLTELAEMSDDITNFLATTLIGIIFVDSKLNLRRFTNYVATEFNVLDQDIGRPIDFISYHFPDLNISTVCTNVIEALTPDEREVLTRRGKTFFMRVVPFRTTDNKILGCVITFVDITAQKQGQIKLQDTQAQLTLAQQASEAKSDFLSRMSHEIRTPMNTLAGLSELLQTQLEDKAAVADSACQIGETVKYMTSIVSDVLEMSKIERSMVELSNAPFSMKALLDRILGMMLPGMTDAGLTFDISVPDRFSTGYMGDVTRIQQLLTNFLSNALKFTPRGGTVSFTATEESVTDGRAVIRFVIADTGIGISEEFKPDLFKPFSRENNGDQYASSSMGLGLSIAYNLIQMMDGDVEVESRKGMGTTFTIHIRLATTPLADGEAEAAETQYDLTGCNVLIAEDHSVNRAILEAQLARRGVSYTSVPDGAEAVKRYKDASEGAFDCILMDMRMPKMNGAEAASLIRHSGRADALTIPIIAVSANAFTEDVTEAKKAGITDYISKPIDTRKLYSMLEKYWIASKNYKEKQD